MNISRSFGAVTLISYGISSDLPLARERGHAQIIIEDMKEGKRRTTLSHLRSNPKKGYAEVEHKPLHDTPMVKKKSPTWLVPREALMQLLNRIENQSNKPTSFNPIGQNGVLSSHNCLTWAIEILRTALPQLPPATGLFKDPDPYIDSLS
jgi:hypothetical protein